MSAQRRAAIADIGFGVIALTGVFLLIHDGADLGPRARLFPMAVLWCLAIAAALIIAQGAWTIWRDRANPNPVPSGSGDTLAQAIAPTALIIGAGVLVVYLGFYLTAPIVILAIHSLHVRLSTGARPTGRMFATGCALALGATAVMYLVFDTLIGLPAPAGALF